MEKNYYITTPIYYVNDKPHIGHTYTSLAADILARFKKIDGYNVFFLTGTDEHGQKVEKSALDKNKNPKEFVDEVSKSFQDLTSLLKLSNNDFIRTTEQRHIKAAQHLWQVLKNNGYIYKDTYKGWYAIRDEAFYSEEELVKNEEGKLIAPSGAEVAWREEESYFFKLSAFQDKLLKYYDENPNFIMPKSRFNETYSFVKGGLKDLSISRSSFTWGVAVLEDNQHIMYVWLDALTNYLTALGYPDTEGDKFQKFWQNAIHLVGKDIIRFHGVYWPAFLMAANLDLPKRIFAHGWWLNEGEKISKSLGNVIHPKDLIDTYGLDSVRYFLFKEINFGNDGNFSHSSMVNRINNELANEYGNLLQRTSSIINKSFNGTLFFDNLTEEQQDFLNKTNNILETARKAIDNQNILKYIESSWEIIRFGNSYIHQKAPWALIKEGKTKEAQNILYFLIEIIRRVSILLKPLLPDSTSKIFSQLNIEEEKQYLKFFNDSLKSNHKINPPIVVFAKYVE